MSVVGGKFTTRGYVYESEFSTGLFSPITEFDLPLRTDEAVICRQQSEILL